MRVEKTGGRGAPSRLIFLHGRDVWRHLFIVWESLPAPRRRPADFEMEAPLQIWPIHDLFNELSLLFLSIWFLQDAFLKAEQPHPRAGKRLECIASGAFAEFYLGRPGASLHSPVDGNRRMH